MKTHIGGISQEMGRELLKSVEVEDFTDVLEGLSDHARRTMNSLDVEPHHLADVLTYSEGI